MSAYGPRSLEVDVNGVRTPLSLYSEKTLALGQVILFPNSCCHPEWFLSMWMTDHHTGLTLWPPQLQWSSTSYHSMDLGIISLVRPWMQASYSHSWVFTILSFTGSLVAHLHTVGIYVVFLEWTVFVHQKYSPLTSPLSPNPSVFCLSFLPSLTSLGPMVHLLSYCPYINYGTSTKWPSGKKSSKDFIHTLAIFVLLFFHHNHPVRSKP